MAMATFEVIFLAGDNIEDSFKEAQRLSNLLGAYIMFNFNGVECHINKFGNIDKGVKSYHSELKNKSNLKKIVVA